LTKKLVGLDNCLHLAADPTFLRSFGFTAVLTVTSFVGEDVVDLAIALLLKEVGRSFFAMRMISSHPDRPQRCDHRVHLVDDSDRQRSIHRIFPSIGHTELTQSWLGTPLNAQGSVIAVTGWQMLGICSVVYLA
jgi:ABC-type sugar transport system permease subunit